MKRKMNRKRRIVKFKTKNNHKKRRRCIKLKQFFLYPVSKEQLIGVRYPNKRLSRIFGWTGGDKIYRKEWKIPDTEGMLTDNLSRIRQKLAKRNVSWICYWVDIFWQFSGSPKCMPFNDAYYQIIGSLFLYVTADKPSGVTLPRFGLKNWIISYITKAGWKNICN